MRQLLCGTINVLKTRVLKISLLFLAPVLSGTLLVLAFPKYDLGWLAWVGLLPLLVAVYGKRALFGFFLAFLCGISFFSGVFYWTLQVSSFTFLHQVILIVYLGSYFGFFGLAFSFLTKRFNLTEVFLTAPFLWVSLEFVRSNMGFMAHPWPLLGHSQVPYPQVIQIASFSGAYGVSFLIVIINSAVAGLVLPLFHRTTASVRQPLKTSPERGASALAGAAALFLMVSLAYGVVTISQPIQGKGIKVSVIQGNIEQSKKWNPAYIKFIMRTYTDLSQEVSKNRPALIIWPEAATPLMITKAPKLHEEVRRMAEAGGSYLLLGSSSHEKFKKGKEAKFYNSAFLISPEDKGTNQRYDKIRLLPFGEYMPMEETIPWHWINVPNVSNYTPGKEFTVFEGPGFRFSVNICWETVFPDMVRQFVKNGAQFVVNITNEAWFGKTAAPYHFLSSNVFRAVENRIYLVRCANTGVSCFIDPYGRIVDRVKDASGQDIFVRGVLTETIIPMDSKTIYTRYGDWLAWLCIGCSALFLIIGLSKHKSNLFSIS